MAAPKLLETYLERRPAIRRFLAARLGNMEDAEDVLQEIFFKLQRTAPPGDIRDPAAYLFRMAMNLASDFRRERMRSRARDTAWAGTQGSPSEREAADEAPSPEAAYGARQQVQQVREALEELSPQCRRVFLMHKFEGLPHAEIAERAGIARSTVEKHMRTALRHLIERLGRD